MVSGKTLTVNKTVRVLFETCGLPIGSEVTNMDIDSVFIECTYGLMRFVVCKHINGPCIASTEVSTIFILLLCICEIDWSLFGKLIKL